MIELTQLFEGVSTKRDRSAVAALPLEERLRQHIIDGERQGLEEVLNLAMAQYPPLDIINVYLLDGMKTVGELFGSGQMQLPFVLQSAETMKAAVAFLEPHMDKDAASSDKGTFLIATVKGDVHDIGKNLVDIILSNNGYRVINLGIKQPVDNIIDAYQEHGADCIAMSGLLVKSTAFMKENLATFNERGITAPVILGGAALTPKFVNGDCQGVYKGRVIYGRDAFSDLNFMDKLMAAKAEENWNDLGGFLDEAEQNGAQNGQNGQHADAIASVEKVPSAETPEAAVLKETVVDTQRSEAVDIAIDRPTPPFWGSRVLGPENIPLEEIFEFLDLQALIAGQWQFRKPQGQSRQEYDLFLAEKAYPILEDLKQQVLSNTLLAPQVVYGYFPCQADGNSLHLYDPAVMQRAAQLPDGLAPVATFDFPRQKSLRRLCISDFFAPRETGVVDVFPMQAVTVGEVATEHAKTLFESDRYTDYLYYYGFSVQMAEAVAEWNHARIRRELGLADKDPAGIRDVLAQRYQGSRYSFGYPACPNMADQYTLLDLLQTERIGMTMDESEQLYPEQSTTAIVAYHPTAKYFSA